MVQIAMLLLAFPLGALIHRRTIAYAATAGVFVIVQVPQYFSTPEHVEIAYWVVQAITAVVAFGLVTWGARYGASRRGRRSAAPQATSN